MRIAFPSNRLHSGGDWVKVDLPARLPKSREIPNCSKDLPS